MNKKLNKLLRALCIVALWIVLIVSCFKAYDLYQYNNLHPQKEYSWNSFDSPPEEYIIKMDMMKSVRGMVLWGILIAIIWEVLLYFNDPGKHFFTYLWRKAKPILDKMGDKLEDE